ncbi:hypothetical protein GMMP1_560018 [Candidatus Magnetomoraceae bacterium gMMP-1]
MLIDKLKKCHILVIGDVMIDEYLWGDVERISPEAPVPIVLAKKESATLGGAGNVVNNLAELSAEVSIAAVVGTGSKGQQLIQMFENLKVETKGLIKDKNRPTTRKTRILAANQQVLRIDREIPHEISELQAETLINFVKSKISEIDIILVSDYGKGLLSRYLLLNSLAIAQKHDKMVIVDPKGVDFTKYKGASLITPNQKEAALASGMNITDKASLIMAGKKIMKAVGLQKLLITRGKAGMTLFEIGNEPFHIKTQAHQVFDVSGAGDTVAAILGLGLASGASFKEAAALANAAAGIVVGKVGTATVSRQELINCNFK